jgi:hypothetical protein
MLFRPVVEIEIDRPDCSILHGLEAEALDNDRRCIGNSDFSLPRADDCLTTEWMAAPIAMSSKVGNKMSSMTLLQLTVDTAQLDLGGGISEDLPNLPTV